MNKIGIAAFLIGITLSSCFKNAGFNCNYDVCGNVATNSEIQAWQNYISSNSITAQQHCSGLFYRIENPGTGKSPGACSNISVRYKGYFTSGAVFDQSTTSISVELVQLIKGWRNVLPLLKAGGRIVLYVPPSLAYGSQEVKDNNGNVVIPPNSYLIFEIDLDAV